MSSAVPEPGGFRVSLFTATRPRVLSKSFKLDKANKLVKEPGGHLAEGRVETRRFSGMGAFADFLATLTPANALAYGLCRQEEARVLAQVAIKKAAPGALPILARTREHFSFLEGAAVMMVDYDPPKDDEPLESQALLDRLYDAWPGLQEAPHVLAHSASSFIFNGSCSIGQRGLRVFVQVADGTDIPRAGKALVNRLWLNGEGYVAISRAGSFLRKCLVDDAVWQPERLDFVGGANCAPPLTQRRPAPMVYNADALPLDTRVTLPSPSLAEGEKVKALIAEAMREKQPEADAIRRKWVEEQVARELKRQGKTVSADPEAAKALREVYKSAAVNQMLLADFVLTCEDGKQVSVGELLDNPDQWHNKRFCDPLEVDYANDKRIAWANLRCAGKPHLYSHAHGGQRFTLHRARQTLRIQPGERARLVGQALELLTLDGGLFQRGGEIVRVTKEGGLSPLNVCGVQLELDRVVRWERLSERKKELMPADAPRTLAEGVLARRGDWPMPHLNAVLSAPSLCLKSGRVIEMDGYDSPSRLLLLCRDLDKWPGVPSSPSKDQLKKAVETLWRPFSTFPFVDPVSRGVMLAAILTAFVRPGLSAAPGYLFSAPTAGSGKTLLAKCLSTLAGQETPQVLAGVEESEEMRKRLLALGRNGAPVIILDNLTGIFESDALCAWLTAEAYTDRVLGASETVSVPTRALVLATGNNVTLKGDLCRRVLTARIDPGVETPWRRKFEHDPAELCREHRLEMVAAGLTILRAHFNDKKLPEDRTASFEPWSDSIRAAVIRIGKAGYMDVEDPTRSIDASYAEDPETQKLGQLLAAWWELFQDTPKTVGQIITEAHATYDKPEKGELKDALLEIAGERDAINPRRLGRWIERNKDRFIEGLRFESTGHRDGAKIWRVKVKVV